MATPDLELALRIRADLVDARRQVRGFNTDLQAATGYTRLTRGELQRATATLQSFGQGNRAVGESARQAAAGLKNEAAALDDVEKKTRRLSNSQRTALDTAKKLRGGDIAGAGEALLQGGLRAGAIGTTAALGGLAAAIAVSVQAMRQAWAESTAYDQALITTGGYVGKTREELAAFARELDAIDSVTTRKAAEAVAQVAASGEFTGEQFELATRAATTWSAATGASIDDTIARFRALQGDPVAALLDLTEKEHFLTEAQLARVRALIEEGREQEAVTEAFRIYASEIDGRAPRMIEALSPLQEFWRGLKGAAATAWDEMVGIYRGDQISAARDRLASMVGMMPGIGNLLGGPAGARNFAASLLARRDGAPDFSNATTSDPVVAAEERARDEWRKAAARDLERTLSNQLRMENEIRAMKAEALKLDIGAEEVAKREAAIRKRYADAESRRTSRGAAKLTEAQQAEQAAQRELDNLERQIALTSLLADGERELSNEARVGYEIKSGNLQLSIRATQQALLAAARRRDAQLAEIKAEEERRQELEETTLAYERLREELRTPAEAAVAAATAQIEDLNAALESGIVDASQYRDGLARIMGGLGEAPLLDAPWTDMTGFGGEQARLDEYAIQLQAHYDTRAQIIAAGRAKGQETEEFWRRQEEQLELEHQDRLASLQTARRELAIASTQSMFASMAEIARHGAGEQSKAYQVLFALSKGFAVAQAAVALAQNVAEASKVGFPQNLPLIAAAFAQGAQIASLLSGANYSGASGYATGGKIRGPGTGTSDSIPIWASNDEFMVRARSARQPGAYAFLDDFNARGMAAVFDYQRRGFAAGGRVSAPITAYSPNSPAAEGAAGAGGATSQANFYLYANLGAAIREYMSSAAGEKQLVEITGNNGSAIRAQWGG